LPLNLKFLIEGEEEVGSPNLHAFVADNLEKLKCDCVVISDSAQFAPGVPAITYGLRGIAYYELRLVGPNRDLHSGTFGGAVTNPATALVRILAELKDSDGRIQIPGFYDDVLPLTDEEREQLAALPFDEKNFREQLDVAGTTGEEGYTTLERRWARPTCDINGLFSGYQGEGAKTVLPAKAGAKLSFRLVPKQDPRWLTAALKSWLEARMPPGIR
ncbi:MAG: peptidase dimerization domain-containing protein, partial [Planctomycetota bacterium]